MDIFHLSSIRKSPRWRQLTPFRIAAIYVVLGAIWILFSDMFLEMLVTDPLTLTRLQTLKGWLFILATGIILYVLINRNVATIRRSEETLRATIESMTDVVIVIDPGGNLVHINRAGLDLFRLAEESEISFPEILRRLQLRYLDGKPIPLEETAILRALLGETSHGRESILRRPDGRDAYVSVSASPVKDSAGRVVMAVGVIRDMTEIRRLEGIREEFISTAAHELKTPVTVIKGYAQWLLAKEPDEHKHKELRTIVRQVERIEELVNEMLRATELQAGHLEPRKEKIDLMVLAREVVERMTTKGGKHRLLLVGEPVTVAADSSQIEIVLMSLLDNAVRYSPNAGDIIVSVAKKNSEAVLSVKDVGLGIPKDKQVNVFQPFFQVQPGIAIYGGMGLGLFMSKQIMERHGGRIWFESEEGQGSTFYFSLPVS